MGKKEMFGLIFIGIGVLSILSNKTGAQMYVEYGKGWGLKNPYAVGRFICIFGGLLFVFGGLLILFATEN